MTLRRAHAWLTVLAIGLVLASLGVAFGVDQPFGLSSLLLGLGLGVIVGANAMKWVSNR